MEDNPPDRIKQLEDKLAEIKARWPAHSVSPSLWQELEEIEAALEKARKEKADGNQS